MTSLSTAKTSEFPAAGGQLIAVDFCSRRPRPVDLVHLATQTQGNRDLETEVLGLFLKQSTIQIARIAAATTPKDQFEAAHKLKGSARAIGAAGVAECAEAVEIAANTGQDMTPALGDLNRAVAVANAFIIDLID